MYLRNIQIFKILILFFFVNHSIRNFEHQCQILKEKPEQIFKSNEEEVKQAEANSASSVDQIFMYINQLNKFEEYRLEVYNLAKAMKRKRDETQQANDYENGTSTEPGHAVELGNTSQADINEDYSVKHESKL